MDFAHSCFVRCFILLSTTSWQIPQTCECNRGLIVSKIYQNLIITQKRNLHSMEVFHEKYYI